MVERREAPIMRTAKAFALLHDDLQAVQGAWEIIHGLDVLASANHAEIELLAAKVSAVLNDAKALDVTALKAVCALATRASRPPTSELIDAAITKVRRSTNSSR
jgi:hypothetical protein